MLYNLNQHNLNGTTATNSKDPSIKSMEIIHRYLPRHNSKKKPNLKNPTRPPTSRHIYYEIDSLKGGGSKENAFNVVVSL